MSMALSAAVSALRWGPCAALAAVQAAQLQCGRCLGSTPHQAQPDGSCLGPQRQQPSALPSVQQQHIHLWQHASTQHQLMLHLSSMRTLLHGPSCSDVGAVRHFQGRSKRAVGAPRTTQPQKKDGSTPAAPRPQRKLQPRRNEQIRARSVQLVLPDGGGLQTMPTHEALAMARQRGLDLMEVSQARLVGEQQQPPLAKLVDYSQWLYRQQQAEAEVQRRARERAKLEQPKEMHFSPRIADHDLEIKLRKVHEFLEDGLRVMLVVKFKRSDETAAALQALDYLTARLQASGHAGEVLPKQSGKRTVSVTMKPNPQQQQQQRQAPLQQQQQQREQQEGRLPDAKQAVTGAVAQAEQQERQAAFGDGAGL